MKITFINGERTFVLEGSRGALRDGDLYLDGDLVGWFNIPDNGWFISGTVKNKPRDIEYWAHATITCGYRLDHPDEPPCPEVAVGEVETIPKSNVWTLACEHHISLPVKFSALFANAKTRRF